VSGRGRLLITGLALYDAEDHRQQLKHQRDHKLEAEGELKQNEYAWQLAEL